MQLASVLLCDAANVREGLVSILSGGITRVTVAPGAPPALMVSIVLALEPDDFGQEARIGIRATTPAGAHPIDVVGTVVARGEPGSTDGLPHYMPFQVGLGTAALMAEPGIHVIDVTLDNEHRQVRLLVGPPVDRAGQPRLNVEMSFQDAPANEGTTAESN